MKKLGMKGLRTFAAAGCVAMAVPTFATVECVVKQPSQKSDKVVFGRFGAPAVTLEAPGYRVEFARYEGSFSVIALRDTKQIARMTFFLDGNQSTQEESLSVFEANANIDCSGTGD